MDIKIQQLMWIGYKILIFVTMFWTKFYEESNWTEMPLNDQKNQLLKKSDSASVQLIALNAVKKFDAYIIHTLDKTPKRRMKALWMIE